MNSLDQITDLERQEWIKPEVELLSVTENTLGAGARGDDGDQAGTS